MTPDAAPPVRDRFDAEGDDALRQFIALTGPDERARSPEEYVARHAHLIGCFALHRYRFRDPALGAWARWVGDLLADADAVERCRAEFLTADERAEVRRLEAEAF